ncbi:MAG: hypothetical protein DMG98_17215 [Acidobacteria bacterium]|nr:MAG: hypothetical protein DMG98_17215 [Acidobacteriota bacterium]
MLRNRLALEITEGLVPLTLTGVIPNCRALNLVGQQILKIHFQVFLDFVLKRSVTGFAVFTNTWALLIYGDVGRNFLRPASAVVVLNTVASQAESFVGMATKNALSYSER